MQKAFSALRELLLDTFFPSFCINCGREQSYLCQDCFALIDIVVRQYCPFCPRPTVVLDGRTCQRCQPSHALAGLFCAASYDNRIVKTMVHRCKYAPYIKSLSKPLASLILAHLIQINKLACVKEYICIPIPLHKRKHKQRGFNQAELIAKELSTVLLSTMLNDVLVKTKSTPAQVTLKKEQRKENIKGAFVCSLPERIQGKRILLVDDMFTTGATMEECSKTLKHAGAKEVWGIVVARG